MGMVNGIKDFGKLAAVSLLDTGRRSDYILFLSLFRFCQSKLLNIQYFHLVYLKVLYQRMMSSIILYIILYISDIIRSFSLLLSMCAF